MTGPTADVAEMVRTGTVRALVVGFGLANRAVARALTHRGHAVVATDDKDDPGIGSAAAALGVELVTAPSERDLHRLLAEADVVFPTPGLPENHAALAVATRLDVPVSGELDLARAWDERPVVAVTGTNGKTTVVELAVAALAESGVAAVAAGNTDLPLVAAIDGDADLFVVEASSFRLAHSHHFSPRVATWLNFAPDHLDVHRDLRSYEAAKARIFAALAPDATAVGNAADEVVTRNLPDGSVTFSAAVAADWHVSGGELAGPDGPFMEIAAMWRQLPHDVDNALAVAATVLPAGATHEGLERALREFVPPHHRVELIADRMGVRYYDDSKATTPHATVAAVRAFPRVVLIAGGRNKGVDLSPMADAVDHVVSVVAIGEAASEITAVFESHVPVAEAVDMVHAVRLATDAAGAGGVVLLSPGCASFDWYGSYQERGDDFGRAVRSLPDRAGA